MKKVLVTGAGGFVGGHLVKYLLAEKNYKVSTITYSENQLLNSLLPEKQIFQGDLTNYEFTKNLVEEIQPDLIFHLAALSTVQDSVEKAQKLLTTNTILQYNLLEAIKTHSPDSRLIAICSANQYGLVDEKNIPIDENTSFNPLNPYAVSKISQEYLALQYHHSYDLELVRLRPFNHTGERQTANFVIPAFAKQITQIEKGEKDPVIKVGNLEAVRDFTDVKDMIKAYLLAAKKCKNGQVYNIGSGKGISIQEILDILLAKAKTEIKVEKDPERMRSSDVPRLIADAQKFKNQTGWKPEIPIENTLERILNYWRKNI